MASSRSTPKALPSTTLPPAQPSYILRGHVSSVNSLHFYHHNTRLLSGDGDGFVVLWHLSIKRPLAVWHAHEGSILGLGIWGQDRVITHGRDSSLRVWQVPHTPDTAADFSTILPVDDSTTKTVRKRPWLLHALAVSTLNFCGFGSCIVTQSTSHKRIPPDAGSPVVPQVDPQTHPTESQHRDEQLVIAVPSAQDTDIVLYSLPSQQPVALIPAPTNAPAHAVDGSRTGMVMALRVFCTHATDDAGGNTTPTLHVIAGYENGRTVLFRQVRVQKRAGGAQAGASNSAGSWEQLYSAQPHAQPILSLDLASDQSSYFTSGADAIVARHPLLDTLILPTTPRSQEQEGDGQQDKRPMKAVNTRHAGQQSLTVRNDGRIFATAGWDARVRVYSAKTVKELAVLKWHREGISGVALGSTHTVSSTPTGENGNEKSIKKHTESTLLERQTVARAREARTRETHWLAAGAKDGKISLWDIY